MKETLRILPLGGMGEIGKNCLVIEYGEDIIVVDAGLMFPTDDMPGVDLVLPDFAYLVERRERVRGILLTHGHEDHIGGLSYLLAQVPAPVYAMPLARGLVEGKLRSRGLLGQAELHTLSLDREVVLGPFQVTPFHVNHSIPDAVGYAIRTPAGLLVHTGDFKIDHTPIYGATTDLAALARLSAEGVRILLSDSTNAESPGFTPSERSLEDTFHRVFSQAEGRVIVATFASLLSRVQLAIETAAYYGRKVAVAGRSMEETVAIAEQLGYIRFPANTRVPLHQIGSLEDHEVCVLATGSQGEPNAALARMAAGTFRHLSIREGDTVVLSSSPIPGNEIAIHRNIDALFRRGARVVYGDDAGVHVSGHAAQEELKLVLNMLRPQHFVPVHGAYRMLYTHTRLAQELGIPRERMTILENGLPLEVAADAVTLGEPVELETVLVDGALVGDVGARILRDRTALAQEGFVVARVSIRRDSGEIVEQPELVTQGFVYLPMAEELLGTAESAIIDAVKQKARPDTQAGEMGRHIKRRLESLFYDETRRRPVIIPVVTML